MKIRCLDNIYPMVISNQSTNQHKKMLLCGDCSEVQLYKLEICVFTYRIEVKPIGCQSLKIGRRFGFITQMSLTKL